MKRALAILLLAAGTAFGQIDNPPSSVNIVDATATGRAVLTASNAAAAATAIGLGTTDSVFFGAVEVGEGDSLYLSGSGIESLGFGGQLNFEERRLSQGGNPILDWGSGFTVTPAATFNTNVTINGALTVKSLATTDPVGWALDAVQTAAATNGVLTLPDAANVLRITNANAISSVTNGRLGAFYYLINQTTNNLTISNAGGITVQGGTPLTLGANQAATLVATGPTNASVAARGDLNDVTLGGTANTAPNQTASSGSSLMTRDLGDARYLPTFSSFVNGNYYYQTMADWMPTRTTNGGTATFNSTGSKWQIAAGTNTDALAAVRLGRMENMVTGSSGANQTWSKPFTVFVSVNAWTRSNVVARLVVGGSIGSPIGQYPTNRAVGVEFRGDSQLDVRLIAHNGTTATNGPWVTNIAGIPYVDIVSYGLRYNTNGQVELYRSYKRGTYSNIALATIGGGPTNNPSGTGFGVVDFAKEGNSNGATANSTSEVLWWGYQYE